MIRIAIIVGSTRPGRRAGIVADWVEGIATQHPAVRAGNVIIERVDIESFDLPLLDEPNPPIFGAYRNAHTRRWAATIGSYDGFVFISPEYNHSIPAALKNAIDYLFVEWGDKAAGFVTYGVQGGIRAAEHLRQILAELKVATVRQDVALSLFTDFVLPTPTEVGVCTPNERQEQSLIRLIDEIIVWSDVLRPLRRESMIAE